MFRVGQEITSKNNVPWVKEYPDEIVPEYGAIYTVRAIVPCVDDTPGLLLNEIRNPSMNYDEGFDECTFEASEFRPVVKRKTNISALKALLNPANHKYREDA